MTPHPNTAQFNSFFLWYLLHDFTFFINTNQKYSSVDLSRNAGLHLLQCLCSAHARSEAASGDHAAAGSPDGAAVIVGIAVQTFMSAGVISTDVCAEQAGTLCLLPVSAAAPLICTRWHVPIQTAINSRPHPHSAGQDYGSHSTDESEDAALPLSRKNAAIRRSCSSFPTLLTLGKFRLVFSYKQ